jgi:hypothetical protein
MIEDFVLKLDFCKDTVYLSDNLSSGANSRRIALINGDYSYPNLYRFSFNHPVDDEIINLRDSLNGTIGARGVCNQVAISDRTDSKSAHTINGIVFPSCTLKYNNYGIGGSIKVSFIETANTSTLGLQCFVTKAHFKPRCEAEINKFPHVLTMALNSSTRECFIHNGTRLTNFPTSTSYEITVQLLKTLANSGQVTSNQLKIVP